MVTTPREIREIRKLSKAENGDILPSTDFLFACLQMNEYEHVHYINWNLVNNKEYKRNMTKEQFKLYALGQFFK